MKTEKRVYKFATGQPIPDGAVYLSTVTQTSVYVEGTQPPKEPYPPHWEPCWLVWHYFLVEVES